MKCKRETILTLAIVFFLQLISSSTATAIKRDDKKTRSSAKTLKTDSEMLDINNIDCWFQNDGSIGENPKTSGDGFYFPSGQRTLSIIYTSGLWFFAKVNGEVRSAVNCYVSEFQPGMILPDGTADDPSLEKYRVYKYNKGDGIDQEAIDQGCPEEVLGDQMVFCVYNDLNSPGQFWKSEPIGIEVRQTAFGYDRPEPMGNIIFIKFQIVNKGTDYLDSAYVAMFFDPDLGNANDDYTGCDTTLKMCYVFNGDEYDEKYGVSVPAMGCDLLQGPVVDAPEETAELPDGTILQDRKILGMTAYFVYLGGSPLAGMSDPHTPEGGYYFARGFRGNGEPWLDPIKGYAPTPFPFYGDPVTGTGWLLSDLTAPKDVRMGVSSGPFSMDVGESQEFIIALVVGRGGDRYNSIMVMRYYDLVAQHMYDSNFIDVTMAPVTAHVAELDEKLMLTWDNEIADFSKAGYNFEGYNIWQAETAEGPWTRITTFDKVNNITRIRDWQYDYEVEDYLEKIVQFGRDSGLTFKFCIDKDYIYDVPLVNGRSYYFAVSGYAYNPDGVLKVTETHRSVVEAVPQRPVLDTKYNTDLGDEIPNVHATGYSDGSCTVIVTDPSSITGDDYLVSFYTLTGGADSGQVAWKLTNTTLDVDLLTDQTHQGYDDAFMSVDGLQVKVAGQLLGVRDIVQVDESGEIVDTNLHHSLNASADRAAGKCDFYIHIQGENGTPWQDRLNWQGNIGSEDYEFRFVDDPAAEGQVSYDAWGDAPPYILTGYQSGPKGAVDDSTQEFADTGGRVPFQVWMIELDGTETQVSFGIFDDNDNGYWDLGGSTEGPWSGPGYNYERLYGTNKPYDEASILADGGAFEVDSLFWGEWWPAGATFGCIVICMYGDFYDVDPSGNWFTEPPAPGTIIKVRTNKPNSKLDTFTFSTADYAPSKNATVAKDRLDDIQIFPNPYFAYQCLESSYYSRFVTFNNLPETCVIRIFSLSGQLVRCIEHMNATPFERWDLMNEVGRPVASGMYIIHIETEFGNRIIKLGVVQREIIYRHF